MNQKQILELLGRKSILIVGYGSQGRAHALNLRDNGLDVSVWARPKGPSFRRAIQDGFDPVSTHDAVSRASIVVLLVPDMCHESVFQEHLKPGLRADALIIVAHGFSVHYGLLELPENLDVSMVAPKSPGPLVRREFVQGRGVPCLWAVHRDSSGQTATLTKAYAQALGAGQAALISTSFQEECESDLFGEQAVLCGGVCELVLQGYQTLVDAGYQKEIAYFECMHELKLIVDLLHEGGFSRMHTCVSDTANYGDLTRGRRVIDAGVGERMKAVLQEIQDGSFAKEWIHEYRLGCPTLKRLGHERRNHPLESVGTRLRSSMAWLDGEESLDERC